MKVAGTLNVDQGFFDRLDCCRGFDLTLRIQARMTRTSFAPPPQEGTKDLFLITRHSELGEFKFFIQNSEPSP